MTKVNLKSRPDPAAARPEQRSKADPNTIRVRADGKPVMKNLGGSNHDEFNSVVLNQVIRTGWIVGSGDQQADQKAKNDTFVAVGVAMAAFKPTDEIEGMLAGQAIAMHLGAMECFRRAMISGQPPEFASKLRKDGANLARGMTDMLAALDRKRGKGQQHIRVERVMVAEGGQAIVGNVNTSTGTAAVEPSRIERGAAPMDVLDGQPEKVVGGQG